MIRKISAFLTNQFFGLIFVDIFFSFLADFSCVIARYSISKLSILQISWVHGAHRIVRSVCLRCIYFFLTGKTTGQESTKIVPPDERSFWKKIHYWLKACPPLPPGQSKTKTTLRCKSVLVGSKSYFFSFFAGSLYLLYVPFIRSAIFTFSSIFHLVCTRPYVLRHFLGYFFINFTVFVLALKKHKSRNKTKQILPDEHQLNTVHLRKSIKLKLSKPTKSSKSTEIANNHTDLYMFGVFHFHPVASRRR